MAQTATKDFVKIPKQEYNLLKEVFRVLPAEAYFLSKNVDIPILSKIRSITLERRVRYVHEFTLPWFWHSRLSA